MSVAATAPTSGAFVADHASWRACASRHHPGGRVRGGFVVPGSDWHDRSSPWAVAGREHRRWRPGRFLRVDAGQGPGGCVDTVAVALAPVETAGLSVSAGVIIEPARVAAVTQRLAMVPAEPLHGLAALAARLTGRPIAAVSLLDDRDEHLVGRFGFDLAQLPVEHSTCVHTVRAGHPLVVPDAQADRRFATHSLVAGGPGLRSYAGVPLRTADGLILGAVCVLDSQSGGLDAAALDALALLAEQAALTLQARLDARRSAERQRLLDAVLDSSDVAIWLLIPNTPRWWRTPSRVPGSRCPREPTPPNPTQPRVRPRSPLPRAVRS